MKRISMLVVVLVFVVACAETQPADEALSETSTTTLAPPSTTQAPPPSSTTSATLAETTTTTTKSAMIEGVAGDYFYEGVPETVPVDTRLSLFNSSAREFHEMVVFKLDPAEQRTIEELSKLTSLELVGPSGFGAPGVGKLVSVVFAMPESPQYTYLHDVPVLAEEGRYIIFCNIPTGMDPIEAQNRTSQGPIKDTDADGMPRHYEVGMMTEVVASG